jgi:hypothetical protein
MEKGTTINQIRNTDEFNEVVNQREKIKWGLRSITFVNGKISSFENEYFVDFKEAMELPHTIKIIEQGDGGTKIERTYTHTALTSFYDTQTGYFYIIGKFNVTYFMVAQPQSNLKSQTKKKHKTQNYMKMQQKMLPVKAYNGVMLTNVSSLFIN